MVIISIVAGVAVLSINPNQRKQYEVFSNQLVNAILLAEQEAMLRPATLGLAFTTHSYQFYTIQRDKKTNQNKWAPITDAPLGSHSLPANSKITLNIHEETIPANGQPKLIITPSNDLTPFVILIGKQGETPYYQVVGKANGEVISEIFKTE